MTTRVLVVDDSPTLRKVVSGILERNGYEAVTAADGLAALEILAGDAAFDLVLLDFVMPRMNGLQFLRAVREKERLSQLPIVLMSAKSDKIREHFVRRLGAIDAISKPFDAQALIALLEHAMERMSRARPPSSSSIPIDDAVEVDDPVRSQRDVGGAALSGDLGAFPIGALLQLLQVEAMTGTLALRSGPCCIRVAFANGQIDLVLADGSSDDFRFGRYLVEEGLLAPDDLEQLLERQRERRSSTPPAPHEPPPFRLGELVREDGRATAAQLRDVLARQSSELLYEVMRWTSGRFEFHRRTLPDVDGDARLGLPVAHVVMEGFRRVDEWRVLESSIGSFDAVLQRDVTAIEALGEGRLTRLEHAVLGAIDGERTIREVIEASHVSRFDACRTVSQFLEARLVRVRASN